MAAQRGVYFDLYGTLLVYGDMSAAWRDWFATIHGSFAGAGHNLDRERLERSCEGLFERPEPRDDEAGLTLFERRLREVCRDLGIELEPDAIRTMGAESLAAWQRYVSLDEEARPLLESLRGCHRLALISNFDHPPHVHALLRDTGLDAFFDAVVISGAVGMRKPDPRIFEGALAATGLAPGEVVHVGDAIEDIEGARAAGIRPLRIVRDDPRDAAAALDFRSDPDAAIRARLALLSDDVETVSSLSELADLLI